MAMQFIKTKTSKKFTRRDLLIGFCAALILAVSLIFPQTAYGETFWLSLFLFAIFPAAAIIFILREPLQNFGLSLGQRRPGIIFSAPTIIIFVLVNYFLLFHTKYGGRLSIPPFIISSFTVFLAFEIFISLPLHLFWEFFFRGFVQMGFERRLGIFSLPLAAVLQALMSFRTNWTLILLIFFSSLAAGLVVRQSRSILYSAISLWIISVSLDIMIIRIVHQVIR